MKMGGTLHFEGEAFINYAETIDGQPLNSELLKLARSDVPICLSYPNSYKNSSNWFVPNATCLRGWLKASGFEVIKMEEYISNGSQRLFGYARKISDQSELLEHPFY